MSTILLANDQEQPGSAVPEEEEVILSILVSKGKGIKGAKGEHVNSFVRVQYADFDYTDSPIVNDTAAPDFNFLYSIPIPLTEASIDAINNKTVTITLFESLPKEKTAVLATCETRLSHFLEYPRVEMADTMTSIATPPAKRVVKHLSLQYLNTKLLQTVAQKGVEAVEDVVPELEIELSISELLLSPQVVEEGNFITIRLDDVLPVPEEWSLREGTEKDLNTSIILR
jgi:hypothetical protein